MTVTPTAEILADGSAVVEAEPNTDQLRVQGVLIGEDDISTGLSGKPTRWSATVLEAAADHGVFEGKPITIPEAFDPEQHVGVRKTESGLDVDESVSLDDKVGEIDTTRYEAGTGLLFEGFISDPEGEELVERGLAQISPVMMRSVEEVDAEDTEYEELYEALEIGWVRDVGLIADGGMPSNSIEAMGVAALNSMFSAEANRTETMPAESGVDTSDSRTMGNDTDPDPNLTETDRRLLQQANHYDDPAVVESADAEALSDYDELLDAAQETDDPEVVDGEEYQSETEALSEFRETFKQLRSEQTGVDPEELTDDVEALTKPFRDEDGNLELEALSQTPETGGEPDTGGDDGVDTDALSEDELSEIESLAARAETFDTIDADHAEALREEAAEIAGADDFDAVEMEVLE